MRRVVVHSVAPVVLFYGMLSAWFLWLAITFTVEVRRTEQRDAELSQPIIIVEGVRQ